MTDRKKKLILDIIGAILAVAFPAAAAITEFPKIQASTACESQFTTFLNVSSTAFAVICVIAAATAWRFFQHRIKMPKSGFFPLVVLYAIVRGVHLIIASFEVVIFWAAIGSGLALILATVADKKYGGNE